MRGFALLIVLWAVVLLAAIGTTLAASARSEVQLAINLRAAASAQAAADAAVYHAAYHLLDPAAPWPANGSPVALALPGGSVTACITNEAGKINPNIVNAGLMAALFAELGVEPQAATRLAQSVHAWRSPSPEAATPYRDAHLPYVPPGAPFASTDELGAVIGMTPELLRQLSPYVSVWTDTDPNPAAAAPVVRRALAAVIGESLANAGVPAPPRTVTIAAQASIRGASFLRRATIRLGVQPNEPAIKILAWDAPSAPLAAFCR